MKKLDFFFQVCENPVSYQKGGGSVKKPFSDRTLSARQSELLMAAVVIARSTSFVFSKLTVASMSPFNILAVRFLTAFAILLALFGGRLRGCSRRVVRNGVLLGLTYSVVMCLEMLGLQRSESSMASLVENSAFMLVPLLEIAFLHTWPEKRNVVGMLLAFAGLLVLNLGPGAHVGAGVWYLLGAMAFYALAIFLTSIFSREGEPLLVGVIQIGTMGVLTLLLSLLFERFRLPATGREWGMILMLAVVCSVFGFTLQPVAQRNLSADRAGMFSVLNPLAAIVWGRLVLAEPLTPTKLLGAALILAGILLPTLVKRKDASKT